jgi:phosphatidylserine decarboxylase
MNRLEPKPLPENFCSVQPGSGYCYRMELAWGGWRRWWLKTFRQGYLRRMAEKRLGSTTGAPHEILDPRDLKFCRNLCTCDWDAADDPFRWREKLPFARWGLAELQIMGWPLLAITILLLVLLWPHYYAAVAVVPAVLFGLVVYFYRDPSRRVPTEAGLIVSPADGKIAEITRLEHDEFIGGPAVRIGIFLSIFNVHINRAPVASRVIELQYNPGLFLNALRADSAWRNENTWIGLEEDSSPHRRLIVRQISGQFARRIVCGLRPGEVVSRGHKFGMIKLGSRTELILPDTDDLKIEIEVGQKVKAGTTIMAKWN